MAVRGIIPGVDGRMVMRGIIRLVVGGGAGGGRDGVAAVITVMQVQFVADDPAEKRSGPRPDERPDA